MVENLNLFKVLALFCWSLLAIGFLYGGTERAIAWLRGERPEAGWLFWFATGCGICHFCELLFIL